VSAKKNKQTPINSATSGVVKERSIRLQPSSSDYATFARTTAKVLGQPAPTGSALKPNKQFLSLVNLGS
jgi:hypothetical protein